MHPEAQRRIWNSMTVCGRQGISVKHWLSFKPAQILHGCFEYIQRTLGHASTALTPLPPRRSRLADGSGKVADGDGRRAAGEGLGTELEHWREERRDG